MPTEESTENTPRQIREIVVGIAVIVTVFAVMFFPTHDLLLPVVGGVLSIAVTVAAAVHLGENRGVFS